MKVRVFDYYNTEISVDSDINVELWIDKFPKKEREQGVMRVVLMREPTQALVSKVMMNQRFYDYVLTYHQDVIDNNPKARLVLPVVAWVQEEKNKGFGSLFGVSSLFGNKSLYNMPGYANRFELWRRRNEIIIPKYFYLSDWYKIDGEDYDNGLVLYNSKDPMFNFQYHIAIENVYMRNCFSEKIIDCFITKTVPIHIGTPNIGDFFDPKGIFVCRDVNDVIDVCNSLSPTTYNSLKEHVEENYISAKKYTSFTLMLKNKLEELIKEFKHDI